MENEGPYTLKGEQVRKFLPHRYPFLLVDRVLRIEPKGELGNIRATPDKIGTRVVAQKNVSFNEPFFQGHFPGFAIFPGVLSIEAMAQTAAFATYPYIAHDAEQLRRGFQVILLGVDGVRFRKAIEPGDVLTIEAVVNKCRGTLWGFDCSISVGNEKVADAQLLANLTLETEEGPSSSAKGIR